MKCAAAGGGRTVYTRLGSREDGVHGPGYHLPGTPPRPPCITRVGTTASSLLHHRDVQARFLCPSRTSWPASSARQGPPGLLLGFLNSDKVVIPGLPNSDKVVIPGLP